MALTSTSPFLALPQELRDLVYKHALDEHLSWPGEFKEWHNDHATTESPQALQTPAREANRLLFYFPAHSPRPTWYNLLLCCQTTNKDIRLVTHTTALDQNLPNNPPAVIDLSLTSTTATATWQKLPCHPQQISKLQVNIRLAHLWDTGILSGAPQADNTIVRVLFCFLQQYCRYGPHLSRASRLPRLLQLETVTLSLEPAFGVEESEYFFGNPSQQLATVSGVLLIWLGRLMRSSLLWESVATILWECRYVSEMRTAPVAFAVTNNAWDEADRETFRALGYTGE